MKSIRYVLWHIYTHVYRAPLKSLLGLGVAMGFIFALGWLQEATRRSEMEVDYLYMTTLVAGEIRRSDEPPDISYYPDGTRRTIQPFEGLRLLPQGSAETLLATGLLQDIYIEAIHPWGRVGDMGWHSDLLLGLNDLMGFALVNSAETFAAIPGVFRDMGDMDFIFASGFNASDFIYIPGQAIPLIVPTAMLASRGMELGAETMLSIPRWADFEGITAEDKYYPARIIGTHNNYITDPFQRDAVLMPLTALQMPPGPLERYMTFRFYINPEYNRGLETVRTELNRVVMFITPNTPTLELWDAELTMVVVAMEQHVYLLRILSPIALGVAVFISLGLAMLLTLQGAKNVAIVRVLGGSVMQARILAAGEVALVAIFGLIIGVSILLILGWGFGAGAVIALAGWYLLGTVLGTVGGAWVITLREPLELLQIRE